MSYVYYRHPSPRRVWTGGSEAQSGPHLRGIRGFVGAQVIPAENSGRLDSVHRRDTSGPFSGIPPPCTFQFFMIFRGRPREQAQGTPRRPKGAKRSPRGAQGEPKGAPNGAKRSKQGRKLYKLTPDQPQRGQYVSDIVRLCMCAPFYSRSKKYETF